MSMSRTGDFQVFEKFGPHGAHNTTFTELKRWNPILFRSTGEKRPRIFGREAVEITTEGVSAEPKMSPSSMSAAFSCGLKLPVIASFEPKMASSSMSSTFSRRLKLPIIASAECIVAVRPQASHDEISPFVGSHQWKTSDSNNESFKTGNT